MGNTAAHIAAFNDPAQSQEILDMLIEHNANVLLQNKNKESILRVADKMAHMEM